MNELIKYFEGLEERIATLEAQLASLEAEMDELKSRPAPEPQVVEKIVEVEKPGASPQSNGESGFRLEGQVEETAEQVIEEPVVEPVPVVEPEPIVEEPASPKAAMYGKAVGDIRLAISLGDRFLYQRELFGQNAELMQKTLTDLNALNSFEEAINYISRFNWDTESNSYQQFLVTLHRRFG